MKPSEFWDYSLQEVIDIIKAYKENQLEEYKFKALCGYNSAMVVCSGVNVILSGKGDVPNLSGMYPTLFPPEKSKPKQQNPELMKARLLEYSMRWKQSKKGKEVSK